MYRTRCLVSIVVLFVIVTVFFIHCNEANRGCRETEEFTGLDKECLTSGECSALDADFCMLDPQTDEGVCVVTDCDTSVCPCGYSCCDCQGSSLPTFCLPEDSVKEMEDFGCNCD